MPNIESVGYLYLIEHYNLDVCEESFSLTAGQSISARIPSEIGGNDRSVVQYVVSFPLQSGDIWPFGNANSSQCKGGSNKFDANLCDVTISSGTITIKNNRTNTITFNSGLRITAYLY